MWVDSTATSRTTCRILGEQFPIVYKQDFNGIYFGLVGGNNQAKMFRVDFTEDIAGKKHILEGGDRIRDNVF